ncbi:MAG: phenylalanine--tRNA ligase subunit alpha [Firmicutes bacterium]|nr:phenylalanine--tRNA ligase subunit alpha [Bacillota bacterium]
MEKQLEKIMSEAEKEISACDNSQALILASAKFVGKQGFITNLLKGLKDVAQELRPKTGALINAAKQQIEKLVEQRANALENALIAKKLSGENVDITIPVKPYPYGTEHPLMQVLGDICAFFEGLGFTVSSGPEVETDYYCFEALNMPKDHPARDMQDTFYVSEDVVLRTHTSSQQIRYMEEHKPPLKLCSVGRVYRVDELDATHSFAFYQVEGLVVDVGITMADLKGTIEALFKHLFGDKVKVRMRPSFFPYTEPSAEFDVTCLKCGGKGCGGCGGSGWMELGGSGMVHSQVLENCGIDSKKYSGFAFGMGIDRLAMVKYGITDIRDLYENDIRLLKQI